MGVYAILRTITPDELRVSVRRLEALGVTSVLVTDQSCDFPTPLPVTVNGLERFRWLQLLADGLLDSPNPAASRVGH